MKWEKFENKYQQSGKAGFGSLNCVAEQKTLYLGGKTKALGFDCTKQYEFLFEKELLCIGLRESETGNKVIRGISKSDKTERNYLIMNSFVNHYGLTGKYTVVSVEKDNDIWVFQLKQK